MKAKIKRWFSIRRLRYPVLVLVLAVLAATASMVSAAPQQQKVFSGDGYCDRNVCYHYIAQWEWEVPKELGPPSYWRTPQQDVLLGSLDLRSIPAQSNAGGTPEGFGLFVYSEQVILPNSLLLGTSLTDSLSSASKLTMKDSLLVSDLDDTKLPPEDLIATDILDLLWKLYTQYADPGGLVRWKPLMPTVKGVMELHLGGYSTIKQEQYDSVKHPLVIEVERNSYRSIREQGDGEIHRRHLSWLMEKYQTDDWTQYVPLDLLQETPLPHRTTFTDNFNRADSTDLGTDWDEYRTGLAIDTNEVDADGTGTLGARWTANLSGDDHYSQAILRVTNGEGLNFVDVTTRIHPTGFPDPDRYTFSCKFPLASPTGVRIYKWVGGVETQLGSNVSYTLNIDTDYTSYFSSDGSTHTGKIDSNQIIQETDTSITGNLRPGIGGYFQGEAGDNDFWDDWEAADLGAPPLRRIIITSGLLPWLLAPGYFPEYYSKERRKDWQYA